MLDRSVGQSRLRDEQGCFLVEPFPLLLSLVHLFWPYKFSDCVITEVQVLVCCRVTLVCDALIVGSFTANSQRNRVDARSSKMRYEAIRRIAVLGSSARLQPSSQKCVLM